MDQEKLKAALIIASTATAHDRTKSKDEIAALLAADDFYSTHKDPCIRIGEGCADIRPPMLAHFLIQHAEDNGVESAIGALGALLSVKRITTRTYAYVDGVEAIAPSDLGDDVIALPEEMAPVGFQEAIARAKGPHSMRRGAVLCATQTASPFLTVPGNGDFPTSIGKLDLTAPGLDRIETANRMLTVLGPAAPTIHLRTTEVEGDELRLFRHSRGYSMHRASWSGGRPPIIGGDPKGLLAQYHALSKGAKRQVDGAITRLNFACSQDEPSEAIVDTAISLEAVLGDNEKTELTYRLRLRAALLMGNDLPQRQSIKQLVAALYSERSKVVHTGLGGSQNRALATEGMTFAASVIRRVLALGGLPDWGELELTGGASCGAIR